VMVMIASKAAITSRYVQDETEAFSRLGKPIVPIVFDEGTRPWGSEDSLERRLQGIVWLNESPDALEGGPSSEAVERIVQAVRYASVRRRLRLSAAVTAAAAVAAGLAWFLLSR